MLLMLESAQTDVEKNIKERATANVLFFIFYSLRRGYHHRLFC